MNTPTLNQLWRNPTHLLAFGFGSGLSPKAPGTAGTLVAVALHQLLVSLPLFAYLLAVAAAILLGIYLCGRTARDLNCHDHPGIVWDEFAGFWLAMTALPNDWRWILVGFVLFRLFDICKPWPIGWCDQKLHGGTGIMLDDLLAGLYSWLILFGLYQLS